MQRLFALIEARKRGVMVFFSEGAKGLHALCEFTDWELVAMPDGRILDAVPLEGLVICY